MADVVTASGLTRTFKAGGVAVRAVDGVDLRVGERELVMVLGRSGAGKTTLLSLIGGLDLPDAGGVTVAGIDVEHLRGAARDRFLRQTIGWVFQTAGLVPLLTAAENVELSLRLVGVDGPELREGAAAALSAVGLAQRGNHRAAELSGGEQQRVALARALAKRPALVVADEPTAQLDSETAGGVLELLQQVASQGTAVLMATHDGLAAEFADRVVTMNDGRVLSSVEGRVDP